MKPKYEVGQMVLHKLDRRRMTVIEVFDNVNYPYLCRFVGNDLYNSLAFGEFELEEDKDIV